MNPTFDGSEKRNWMRPGVERTPQEGGWWNERLPGSRDVGRSWFDTTRSGKTISE